MRAGDILLVGGSGLMSKAIRQVTGGTYSHAELLAGGDVSIGAMQGQGVRTCNWRQAFKGERFAICEAQEANLAQASRALEWAGRMSGKDYDARALAGMWLKFALRRLGLKMKGNPAGEGDKWFCSELVAAAYLSEDVALCDVPASLCSPTDLFTSHSVRILDEGVV